MSPVDQIDLALLKIVAPENTAAELILWAEPIKGACHKFGIDTVREVGCFLGQGAHESAGFTDLSENLNYSADRLTQVWPRRFPTLSVAAPYGRNPEKLANFTYANRLGNGPETSGDGWRYRGAGIFQVTGKSNYTALSAAIGVPLAKLPDYIRTKEGAAQSAGWFWKANNLDKYAATPGVEDETKIINGGLVGVDDRRARTTAAINELVRRGC